MRISGLIYLTLGFWWIFVAKECHDHHEQKEREDEEIVTLTIVNSTDEYVRYSAVKMSKNLNNGVFYDWFLPKDLSDLDSLPPHSCSEFCTEMPKRWLNADQNYVQILFYTEKTLNEYTREEILAQYIYDRYSAVYKVNPRIPTTYEVDYAEAAKWPSIIF